ncbi:uncharacterized protein V1516DRAFT_625579 [Lipomyces oligophaga]|uniref:uncharacterized protein n=1 Tax=Lipomyces oligophaga TaxID=45792 RepID=UPI0034CFA838
MFLRSTLTASATAVFLLAKSTSAVLTYVGCFSSAGSLVFNDTYEFQTDGYCQEQCAGIDSSVLGLIQGSTCYCGNAIPSGQVSDDECDVGCYGYGINMCGGLTYYSVYLTGVGEVENAAALESALAYSTTVTASSTALSATSSKTQTTTSSTAAKTSSSTTSSTSSSSTADNSSNSSSSNSSSSKSSKSGLSGGAIGGIVVGVVLGLAILAALIFFFLRRRRQQDEEDDDWPEYAGAQNAYNRSNRSLNSGRVAIVDQRLNPMMTERRFSDGSLSDEQDYSRKILRVVNQD